MGRGLLGDQQTPVRGYRSHVVVDELDRLALAEELDGNEIPKREARQGRCLDDVTVGLPGSRRAHILWVVVVATPPRRGSDAESWRPERIGMPQTQEMRKLVRCQPGRRRDEVLRGARRPPRDAEQAVDVDGGGPGVAPVAEINLRCPAAGILGAWPRLVERDRGVLAECRFVEDELDAEGAVDGSQPDGDRCPLGGRVSMITDRLVGLAVKLEIGHLHAAVGGGGGAEPIIGQIRSEEGIVAGVAAERVGAARADGILEAASTRERQRQARLHDLRRRQGEIDGHPDATDDRERREIERVGVEVGCLVECQSAGRAIDEQEGVVAAAASNRAGERRASQHGPVATVAEVDRERHPSAMVVITAAIIDKHVVAGPCRKRNRDIIAAVDQRVTPAVTDDREGDIISIVGDRFEAGAANGDRRTGSGVAQRHHVRPGDVDLVAGAGGVDSDLERSTTDIDAPRATGTERVERSARDIDLPGSAGTEDVELPPGDVDLPGTARADDGELAATDVDRAGAGHRHRLERAVGDAEVTGAGSDKLIEVAAGDADLRRSTRSQADAELAATDVDPATAAAGEDSELAATDVNPAGATHRYRLERAVGDPQRTSARGDEEIEVAPRDVDLRRSGRPQSNAELAATDIDRASTTAVEDSELAAADVNPTGTTHRHRLERAVGDPQGTSA